MMKIGDRVRVKSSNTIHSDFVGLEGEVTELYGDYVNFQAEYCGGIELFSFEKRDLELIGVKREPSIMQTFWNYKFPEDKTSYQK
jgi:hypothetical protein